MLYDRTYVDADGYEHRYFHHRHGDDEKIECLYCGVMVPGCEDCQAPPVDDDVAWYDAFLAHAAGCEWVETRAHQID